MAQNLWVEDGYVEEGWIQSGVTVNWATDKVIFVPKAYMELLQTTPVEVRRLDTDAFFRTLKDLESSEDGMPWSDTQQNASPTTLGGLTYARVLEIIDPYTITFEDGQYVVELVGSNNNISAKTNKNQVSVSSNNSAGLIQTDELQYSAYQDKVTLDQTNSTGRAVAGQEYPIGTVETPVDNLADALFIANRDGFDTIEIKGNFTFGASDVIDNFIVQGDSATRHVVVLTDSASITNCIFRQLTILGNLDGGCSASNCITAGLNYIDGSLLDCLFSTGSIVLSGVQANFLRCGDAIADSTGTNVDLNGGGTNLVVADHKGDLEFSNCNTAGADVQIGLDKGKATFNADITEGFYRVFGVGTVVDNSTGNAVVDVTELLDPRNVNAIWRDQGLDPANPLTINENGDRTAGDITIDAVTTGTTPNRQTTLTRQ